MAAGVCSSRTTVSVVCGLDASWLRPVSSAPKPRHPPGFSQGKGKGDVTIIESSPPELLAACGWERVEAFHLSPFCRFPLSRICGLGEMGVCVCPSLLPSRHTCLTHAGAHPRHVKTRAWHACLKPSPAQKPDLPTRSAYCTRFHVTNVGAAVHLTCCRVHGQICSSEAEIDLSECLSAVEST